jgi:hypothetical protein
MRLGLVLHALLAATTAVGTLLFQANVSGAAENRTASAAAAKRITAASAGPCWIAFDTQTSTITPPDDSTSDNPPASTIDLRKPCVGEVIGTFSSEVSTTGAGSFIHIDMRATCIATGGFTSPCTVGTVAFASPGHTFFQNNVQPGIEVNTTTMVWNTLPRGVWRFQVLPGGGGGANLQFRTFVVTTLRP